MVLDGSYNLTEANYKDQLQNLVDRVLITDKDGNQIGVVEDTAARKSMAWCRRPTSRRTARTRTDRRPSASCRRWSKKTGSVTGCPRNSRAVSGYADRPGNHYRAIWQVLYRATPTPSRTANTRWPGRWPSST